MQINKHRCTLKYTCKIQAVMRHGKSPVVWWGYVPIVLHKLFQVLSAMTNFNDVWILFFRKIIVIIIGCPPLWNPVKVSERRMVVKLSSFSWHFPLHAWPSGSTKHLLQWQASPFMMLRFRKSFHPTELKLYHRVESSVS